MSEHIKHYMTRAVPRYTSYPTVPHFTADVGPEDYVTQLEQLDPSEAISLYLHVPFCRELCWYCGCNMKLATREAPLAQYAATLRQEIELLASYVPGRLKISHLHWGGGTPTALVPDDLAGVMDVVRKHFDINEDAELAIESDPRTLTDEMTCRIGALGFNRASFGVQEFDPRVQAAINRIQPPDMVARSVDGLRQAGVQGINFDLIYGLPHQSVASLEETIRLCLAMAPDRIALFGYAHVPWMAKKQRLIDEAALPGAAERLAQAQGAAKLLSRSGYVALGLDHFARPEDALSQAANEGRLRRNFQGYTTDQAKTLLGVGATSIGRTPSSLMQNIIETGAWARSIKAGRLPIMKGCLLDQEDQLRGFVIEQIMCNSEVDLVAAGNLFGRGSMWFEDAMTALVAFNHEGLIVFSNGHLRVTQLGLPVIRVIASVFDTYLASNHARHAVAV